jgi:GNAT superfamily N-acetyltransferase
VDFYRPCPLDPDKHGRSRFDCGEPSLDEWLKKYSGQNRRGNWAATWVIADEAHQVVAFASLSMAGIARDAAPARLSRGAPRSIPALLVGRLATDRSVAGRGLATALVSHVLATAVELNAKAACAAVVVTALNRSALSWWSRFGFVPFDPADPANFDLYLLTQDIAATLARGT